MEPTMMEPIMDAITPPRAKAERSGPRERKRRGPRDAMAGAPTSKRAPTAKTNLNGLREAVSQRDSETAAPVDQCTPTRNSGSGAGLQRSNTAREKQSPGLGTDLSYHQIAYNEYLTHAFGLSGEDQGPWTEQPEDSTGADVSSTSSRLSATSMELSFRLSLRDRRPKIQLTIPRTKSKRYAAIAHHDRGHLPESGPHARKEVSPPSTPGRHPVDAGVPARRSIISPWSKVEMPTPRRPFSTFSFEKMTDDVPNGERRGTKSASSGSSDDTGERDGKSSNYSPHSSVSSLASDSAVDKATAVAKDIMQGSRVASSMAAASVDVKPSASWRPQHPRQARGMRSTMSLNDANHRNKPLPPAPGPDAVKPLNYSTLSLARTSSMYATPTTPGPRCVSRQSTMSIASHQSLRSKYTPIDMITRDSTFQPSSPRHLEPPARSLLRSPTLSQAELELEAHLCSIEENFPLLANELPRVHDPLQVSRGPMHMEPSRKPPSPPFPPGLVQSPYTYEKIQTKKSVAHVAMQMRPGTHQAISSPLVGSNDKAHRVLGTTCKTATVDRATSADARWKTTDSPHSSPNLSMDDSDTLEGDRSPLISDAAFEEVRQRLELLSPKRDALQDYLKFRPNHRSIGGETPRRHEASTRGPSNEPEPIPSSSRSKAKPTGKRHRVTPAHLPGGDTRSPGDRSNPPRLVHRIHHDPSSSHSPTSVPASSVPAVHADRSPIRLPDQEAERMISANAAEKVLLRILENLGNLQDLFATASVSRGFYRTFKRHELPLMKNALYAMSPAAWELREMSVLSPNAEDGRMDDPTPLRYLQSYWQDLYTVVVLKSTILDRCESFLRANTITALAGNETERASQIDDAFWRVWTFCRLFGCGTQREDDIVHQMDWLQGGTLVQEQRLKVPALDSSSGSDGMHVAFTSFPAFGQGNRDGLSAEELYDMDEIWNCLRHLVSGFQGKRELAREYGIFENATISVGEVDREDATLEEWTHYLLTWSPHSILDVKCPSSPTATTFAHAHSRGYTSWSPPSDGNSRSTFLKEAVSRVYQGRMLQRHPVARPAGSEHSPSSATSEGIFDALRHTRMEAHKAEIRAKRKDPAFKALLPSEERPMSNFPEVLRKLENSPVMAHDSASTTTLSSLAPSSQLVTGGSELTTPPASVKLSHSASSCYSVHDGDTIPTRDSFLGPQVRDPVDIALERLVNLGFDAKTAAKALAETDTGNNIDFDRALETLVRQRKRTVSRMPSWNHRSTAVPEMSNDVKPTTTPKPTFSLGIRGAERYA